MTFQTLSNTIIYTDDRTRVGASSEAIKVINDLISLTLTGVTRPPIPVKIAPYLRHTHTRVCSTRRLEKQIKSGYITITLDHFGLLRQYPQYNP